jgi:hypothetical protein
LHDSLDAASEQVQGEPVPRSHSIVEILMFAMCYAIAIVGIVLTFF